MLLHALIVFSLLASIHAEDCCCKENDRILRREVAIRTCSEMFRKMDSAFSKAILSGNSTSIAFRKAQDEILNKFIVKEFTYSLIEDQPDAEPEERYVSGEVEIKALLKRFAEVTYAWRPTLPPISNLDTYQDEDGFRKLTLQVCNTRGSGHIR